MKTPDQHPRRPRRRAHVRVGRTVARHPGVWGVLLTEDAARAVLARLEEGK